MKSRVNELISRSTAAMISAIEIYNKPNFLYRGETFAILAINSWELIIKAKWLSVNNNNINSLYVYENKNNKDGKKSRRRTIKLTKSNNPFTHSIGKIANLLINSKLLDNAVWANLEILIEIRDSAIHFYNFNERLTITLQEVAAASIRNYLMVLDDWFRKDLSKYNFYLMPLSFISPNQNINSLVLNTEEKNFFKYIEVLKSENINVNNKFDVTLSIDVKFLRSQSKDAISVTMSDDEDAIKVILTEEKFKEKYPWSFSELVTKCRERYIKFKANKKFYKIKEKYVKNKRYVNVRKLDPDKPNGVSKKFYSPNIFEVFDENYEKKIKT